MVKIGLLFPGQGSQYVGMGKDLFENFSEARSVFDNANSILGYDIKKIIFEGPEETLRQTQYTQPAIFITSVAAFEVFSSISKISKESFLSAGHSLGEYSSFAASNAFSLKDGLNLVNARGKFINNASQKTPGTMAAIIGLDKNKVQEICTQSRGDGICESVNFNCPVQIVIAGTIDSINKACQLAQESGATRAIVLNVSGPFHSSLMTQASIDMTEEIKKYQFNNPEFPVITNCDALPTIQKETISDKLVKQINNPVLWEESIKRMIASGCDIFIEIGPGRVLTGLMRRIDKTKKVYNIEDKISLDKTLQVLEANFIRS